MKLKKVLLVFIIASVLMSCRGRDNSLTIAMQYGLAYAPLQIMKEKGFLEAGLEGTEIKWVKLANTAAIREAALAGDVDAGFLGIPPFLIARDQGMNWKLLCGLSRAPLGLVVPVGKAESLSDLSGSNRIALPQPGSIQHILLSMAVKKEMGQADLLDSQLVSLKHPDGMNALLSGAVEGHFTSPPYIFQESDDEDYKVLLTGEDAMGGAFTFIASMVTESSIRKNPDFPTALKGAIEESIRFLTESEEESLAILSTAYNLDPSLLRDYMSRPGLVYDTDLKGVDQFIRFMSEAGYLEHTDTSDELLYR